MRRLNVLFVCAVAVLFLSVALHNPCRAYAAAAEDEITKCTGELTTARAEMDAYRKQLLANPDIVNLNKEIASLNDKARAKDKDLATLLDSKLNKNQAYLDLVARSNELNKVNADIGKIRVTADNDPEAQKLKKEAADLRAKAQTIDQEAKKLADSKFESSARDLLSKKASLANAAKEVTDYRNKVMNDPVVKSFQADSADLRKQMTAKGAEFRNLSDKILKSDEKYQAMEARVKELTKKLQDLRAAQAKALGTKAAAKAAPAEQKATKKTGRRR